MYIKRFYHEALGHASYLVGCTKSKQAIVVDPSRIVAPYIRTCDELGFTLKAVAETHIHADYVSGARELWAEKGCAWYFFREKTELAPLNGQKTLACGEAFFLGELCFDVLHTPGHTPEHICYLVTDGAHSKFPVGLFSGDFLFVGDVGRPDLLEKVVGMAGNAKVSAYQMFQSIQSISKLPDYIQVWPSHGAGSLCGKALGALPNSTLGYERRVNWAFQVKEEEAFVEKLLDAQPEAPPYFAKMKQLNEHGPNLLRDLEIPLDPIPGIKYDSIFQSECTIVDARSHFDYAKKFIPNTINIPYGKSFIQWAGWLLRDEKPLYIIASRKDISAITGELMRIGLDHIGGFMDADEVFCIEDREYESYPNIPAKELDSSILKLDVRQDHEYNAGHMMNTLHIPLGKLEHHLESIPKEEQVAVYCQAGLRSAIAMSILRKAGLYNTVNVQGGYNAWVSKEAGIICS